MVSSGAYVTAEAERAETGGVGSVARAQTSSSSFRSWSVVRPGGLSDAVGDIAGEGATSDGAASFGAADGEGEVGLRFRPDVDPGRKTSACQHVSMG